jgi:hypothetical protein
LLKARSLRHLLKARQKKRILKFRHALNLWPHLRSRRIRKLHLYLPQVNRYLHLRPREQVNRYLRRQVKGAVNSQDPLEVLQEEEVLLRLLALLPTDLHQVGDLEIQSRERGYARMVADQEEHQILESQVGDQVEDQVGDQVEEEGHRVVKNADVGFKKNLNHWMLQVTRLKMRQFQKERFSLNDLQLLKSSDLN